MSENHTPISRARKLRKKMTPEEKILWSNLRNRKLKGLKFLRQHPIVYDTIRNKPKFFIPDFYCAEKKLIIEVDGKIHEFQKDYDERREEILRNMGLRVIRFKNEEFKDISVVLRKIREFVDSIS
ncbi:MAG TPA: endonuclease domain-containing protein [Tangfeifania sp.]|nr:endonuclease domain-containing protein [Tangfeifania sp.]